MPTSSECVYAASFPDEMGANLGGIVFCVGYSGKRDGNQQRMYEHEPRVSHCMKKVENRHMTTNDESIALGPTKRCYGVCKKVKPCSEFGKDKSRPDGLLKECKECKKLRNANFRSQNKDKVREYNQKYEAKMCRHRLRVIDSRYHMPSSLYEGVLSTQNHVCAICKKQETVGNDYGPVRLSVDHDHATGRFRGLLCSGCNLGLGSFQENPESLLSAIDYLKNPPLKAMGLDVIVTSWPERGTRKRIRRRALSRRRLD